MVPKAIFWKCEWISFTIKNNLNLTHCDGWKWLFASVYLKIHWHKYYFILIIIQITFISKNVPGEKNP